MGHFVWVKPYASGRRHTEMRHEQAYLLAKGYPEPSSRPPCDVLPFKYTVNRHHPTEKPVEGLLPLITALCPVGGVVLDPFAGSGAVGVAARACQRRCVLIEHDAGHFATIQRRLGASSSAVSAKPLSTPAAYLIQQPNDQPRPTKGGVPCPYSAPMNRGRAEVRLIPMPDTGEVDWLESGVEVTAKPPGKEPRSISQLSG
ncbi:MAG: hypothetical protein IBJ18_03990, partial [Phycisphaerales bacterium]|nr:hypothetical protein [Phycisphaerales bacterium]